MANSGEYRYRRVVEHLGLQKYYPRKLSREEALVVSENVISSDDLKDDATKIPWYILQNLITCNYEGRCFDLDENQTFCGMDHTMILGSLEEDKPGSDSDNVSPPDALVALFLCCDDFLRQILIEKLSMCQLAIPLLLPIFDANNKQEWELIVWGISTLRKKWKTSSGSACEKSMAVHQLPTVSALRIGRPQISKSKILNCVVNEQKHDIFFHSGCKGGNLERKISNGLLEMTWYLPNQKTMNTFPDALTFLNLRGNASKLKQQTDFLSEISVVTIAFMSSDDFKEEDTVLLESLYRQNGHLIMLIDGAPRAYLKEYLTDMCDKFVDTKKKIRFISFLNKNELKISGEILKLVTSNFEGSFGNVVCDRSIEMYTEVAQRMNFYVDELLPDCSEAKQSVNKLVNLLRFNGKENELPLQRITVNIGDKKKEQCRLLRKGNKHIETYVDQVKTEITDLRRQQLRMYQSSKECTYNMFRKSFTTQHLKRKYFFGFVKIMTDRYSLDILQPIRQEYIEKWNALCDAKKEAKTSKASLESKKKELDELEQKLSRYSLGLEHFNREIGQHYEMSSHLKLSDLNESGNQFAIVAAEMLLYGYPIELMDGDASHVPLAWIEAVLNALKSKVGNKRMFVLSVLGIQSSGKSTMLNAMFGLQFAVSAGRCTKGIFAQLVPVDDNLREDTNCDYIMVVDTEGLRAPEFASVQQSSNHDNELATLVIGLGDATIINIMGENPTDMQDTLQIAVHAIMKMENVNIKSSCILFVHQNVTDVTASDMNTAQKRNMRELLDKITRIAAAEANCSEVYRSFSDVINFQENKHIMYVSSLWQGDPPMAPPNPGYSKCILQVKQQVFNFMKKSEVKTIDVFKNRLSDLWRAILFQNFVFSFKNSLEIQVFNALDTEYVRHSRTLRRNAMAYSDRLQVECKKLTATEIKKDGIIEPYLKLVDEDSSIFKSKMDEYFSCEDTACQWKGKTETKMSELCRDIRKELKDEFTSIRKKIIGRAEIDDNIKRYEREISRKAEELAESFRNKKSSTMDLESEFAEHWKMWVSIIPHGDDYTDVEETSERVVVDSNLIRLQEDASRVLLTDLSKIQVCEDDLDFGNVMKRIRNRFGSCGKSKQTFVDDANWKLQNIREETLKRISTYRRDGRCYNMNLGVELFESLSSQLEAIEIDRQIRLTSKGRIRLTVCNFKWSLLPSLKSMQEQYIRENDLHLYMESQKDRLWQMFRDECTGLQKVTKATSVVSRELESAIKASLPDQCKLGIIDHLRQPTTSRLFANKKSLHGHMLIDMAEKRSFRLFEDYFSDPKQCMDNFIAKHIETVCFQTDDEGNSVLQEIYSQKTRDRFSMVWDAIDASYGKCDGMCTMKTWWPILLEIIGNELSVKPDIVCFNEDENLDLDELRGKVRIELKKIEDRMVKSFDARIFDDEVSNKCQEFFRKDLLGCRELCPFCKALCDLQTSNAYDGHSTELHRPQGVAGYKWHETRKLNTSVCTTLLSGYRFMNADTNGEWHSYSDYRSVNEYYKSWDIKPMAGESELYWRWFMVKYNKELAERYKCEEADIPDGWNEISWESVKEDIMKHL